MSLFIAHNECSIFIPSPSYYITLCVYIYRPEPEAEDTPVDCSEACAIPPPKVTGDSEVDKKTN